MYYVKYNEDGTVFALGTCKINGGEEITGEEYETILAAVFEEAEENAPEVDPDAISADEALNIIFGGDGA